MAFRATTSVAILISSLVTYNRNAAADCDTAIMGGSVWGNPQVTVNVYMHSPTNGPEAAGTLANSTGKSYDDTLVAVKKAINIINEESGAAIKLRYAGFTDSRGEAGASPVGIVLRGDDCADGVTPVGGGAKRPLGSIAQAVTTALDTNGFRKSGYIRFFDRRASVAMGTCDDINWTFTEDATFDIVSVLIHEFGHIAFNIGDLDTSNCALWSDDIESVMDGRGYAHYGPTRRVLKEFDQYLMQYRYAPRGKTNTIYRGSKTSGSTSWSTATQVSSTGSNPMYRFGSVTQDTSSNGVRAFAYLSNPNNYAALGYTGEVRSGKYVTSFASQGMATGVDNLMRPGATAVKSGTQNVLAAYIKRANTMYLLDSYVGLICYRLSPDGGSTYGPETCGTVADSKNSFRNGLTATYDPNSDAFLVSAAGLYGTTGNTNRLKIWVIPAPGNTTMTTSSIRPVTDSTFGNSVSHYAPSIACKFAANGCLITFANAVYLQGCATVRRFTVNPTTGAITFTNASQGLACYPLLDQPSTAYDPTTDEYYMAVTSEGQEVRTLKFAASTSTWYHDGTVWSNTNSFVSTPAIGFIGNATPSRLEVWFLRYW
jgi:hypothetical protein